MSKLEGREQAIRASQAATNGRLTVHQVLEIMAPTWHDMSAFDRAELEQRLRENPAPTPEQQAAEEKAQTDARARADQHAHDGRVQQINEARAYRELNKKNPFAAANYAIERGPHVYTDPDDDGGSTPSAA